MAQPSSTGGMAAVPHSDFPIIIDGSQDIAKSSNLERMLIIQTGRIPLRTIYLWMISDNPSTATNSKRSKSKSEFHSPSQDGPQVAGICPPPPLGAELEPHENALPYLEVGPTSSNHPAKYKPDGKSRDRERKAAQRARGVLDRDENVLRVFTPRTELIQGQLKCFFHDGVNETKPHRNRLVEIATATKYHAAKERTPPQRAVAAIFYNDLSKAMSANPLMTTRPEVSASSIALQASLFLKSKNAVHLESLSQTLTAAHPGLKYGQRTQTNAVAAFMNYDVPMNDEHSQQLVAQIMVSIEANIVKTIQHGLFRRASNGAMEEIRLLHQLPQRTLPFNLACCHDIILGPDVADAVVDQAIESTLLVARQHNKFLPATTQVPFPGHYNEWSVCGRPPCWPDQYSWHAGNGFGTLGREKKKKTPELYGALLKQKNVSDLMTKLGNALDVASVHDYMEQLSASHAVVIMAHAHEEMKVLESIDRISQVQALPSIPEEG
ncbi:hypothetical protein HJFPF1_09915 [Paramyrothecium foliicola]|nr:hypothetical protein HJFPF1_09915 [Paramyrothecium foliicola]